MRDPAPLAASLSACTAPGGVVSILALNARTMAVRPALERRFADALGAFDTTTEQGVLDAATRADTVEDLSHLLGEHGIATEGWYGVWLFSDWLAPAGVPADEEDLGDVCAAQLEASRRDPYRHLSRLFHLVGARERRVRAGPRAPMHPSARGAPSRGHHDPRPAPRDRRPVTGAP